MGKNLKEISKDFRKFVGIGRIKGDPLEIELKILGVGLDEPLKDSLKKQNFGRALVLTTLNPECAREILETGEMNVLIYNLAGGNYETLRKVVEKQENLYVALTLGWIPQLNRNSIYGLSK